MSLRINAVKNYKTVLLLGILLALTLVVATGCDRNPNKVKPGMRVTNGPCVGTLLVIVSGKALVTEVVCDHIYESPRLLKEVATP